jgi:DNA-binding NarL/FixJ family response regulator
MGFGGMGASRPKPPPAKGPPRKPKPVEARRAAPRGNKPFSDPCLSPGENKTAEMILNGYSYDEIADEMMTSRDVVKKQASVAQQKLGTDVRLPMPGMGKRPPGSTKREAAFELFDSGVDNAQIAERLGISVGNVRTYRSYWKQRQSAPVASVEGAMYNPPSMPERPFEAD